MNFKTLLPALLTSFFVSQYSLATTRPPSINEPVNTSQTVYSEFVNTEDPRPNLVISTVVLKDSKGNSICQEPIYKDSPLAPNIDTVASRGFKSNLSLKLRHCEKNELEILTQFSSEASFETQVAVLPAALWLAVSSCSIGAVSGVVLESFEYAQDHEFGAGARTAITVSPAVFSALDTKYVKNLAGFLKYAAGVGAGLISYGCSMLTETLTEYGLEYLLE